MPIIGPAGRAALRAKNALQQPLRLVRSGFRVQDMSPYAGKSISRFSVLTPQAKELGRFDVRRRNLLIAIGSIAEKAKLLPPYNVLGSLGRATSFGQRRELYRQFLRAEPKDFYRRVLGRPGNVKALKISENAPRIEIGRREWKPFI